MRPDIFELQDLLETWEDFDNVEINPDALKIKLEAIRKEGKKSTLNKTRQDRQKVGRNSEISEQDIKIMRERIAKQRLEEQKKLHVPFYQDYDAKMKSQLGKNQAKGKPAAKKDDFEWADFDSSKPKQAEKAQNNDFWSDFGGQQTTNKATRKKGTQPKKVAQKNKEFDFEFDNNSSSKSKEKGNLNSLFRFKCLM